MPSNISVLRLTLHGVEVGHLIGHDNGRNHLVFSESFIENEERPSLGLITHRKFPNSVSFMKGVRPRNQQLEPLLSNLLPEGALRELLAKRLRADFNHEFKMLAYLGNDLPGALIATPLEPGDVPAHLLSITGEVAPLDPVSLPTSGGFSLAGVQVKFSMVKRGSRFTLSNSTLGDWIIKTPSVKHAMTPQNEFTSMTLAKAAGVNVPEIDLIPMADLDNLPELPGTTETMAYGIKRFDRDEGQRIHMEDFAQVFNVYAHKKYDSHNQNQIAQVIYQYSEDRFADVQELIRRYLVNLLLANGDAHLKNYSLYYPDGVYPRLSPAYDILFTLPYIKNEDGAALNLSKTKAWSSYRPETFLDLSTTGIPKRLIKRALADTMETARSTWPALLDTLPMADNHKDMLRSHWASLHPEFKIL